MKRLDYIDYLEINNLIALLVSEDTEPITFGTEQNYVLFQNTSTQFIYEVYDQFGVYSSRDEPHPEIYKEYRKKLLSLPTHYTKVEYELFYNSLMKSALHAYKIINSLRIKYDI